jgi:hypothetical protein
MSDDTRNRQKDTEEMNPAEPGEFTGSSMEELQQVLGHLLNTDIHLSSKDLPGIDLYMDQVTTFLEQKLAPLTRHPGEDKTLTKTMINNYAKADLLIAPVRKKYGSDHLMLLLIIYFFKNFMSINDVQQILQPLKDKCFTEEQQTGKPARKGKGKNGEDSTPQEPPLQLQQVFDVIEADVAEQMKQSRKDLEQLMEKSAQSFPDADPAERDMLQSFDCLCRLGADIYFKKLFIEKTLDQEKDGGGE